MWGSFRLYTRVVILLLSFYCVFLLFTFSRNQSRFQTYLDAQYITWDDFPPDYADALRTKEPKLVEEFDYSKSFPPADTDSTTQIPPIIHFIWFKNLYDKHLDVTQIPTIGSDAPELCKKYNPEYTINVWNASAARQLLEDHYSWFLPTYDSYSHPIQRVDAFKYFVLWHYGGIYMDLDIACRRPLEPLLQYPAWFAEASPLGVNNDLIATRAGHPVVMLMLQSLQRRNRNLIFPYLTIFWSTGPQFTSDLLKEWFLEHPPGYVKGTSKKNTSPDEWFILPQVFYSEEYTFFGHSPGGTWHEGDVAVVLCVELRRCRAPKLRRSEAYNQILHSPQDFCGPYLDCSNAYSEKRISGKGCTPIIKISPTLVMKYGAHVKVTEAESLMFLEKNAPNIPVPRVHACYILGSYDRNPDNFGSIYDTHIIMTFIEGQCHDVVWDELDQGCKTAIAAQLHTCVHKLRSISRDSQSTVASVSVGPLGDPIFDYHSSQDDFSAALVSVHEQAMSKAHLRYLIEGGLAQHKHKIVLTHGDLQGRNVMVTRDKLVGMIDWETCGWYPEYWEFAKCFCVAGWPKDWPNFVSKHLQPYYCQWLLYDMIKRHVW
nr:inositol phosphoceramide mannosyltransferase 3 [Quercus suber]